MAAIPASQVEVGAEGAQVMVARLENLFRRAEAGCHTTSTEENTEILRARLFDPLGAKPACRGRER